MGDGGDFSLFMCRPVLCARTMPRSCVVKRGRCKFMRVPIRMKEKSSASVCVLFFFHFFFFFLRIAPPGKRGSCEPPFAGVRGGDGGAGRGLFIPWSS